MNIKQNSWHFKLFEQFGDGYYNQSINICQYINRLFVNLFFSLGVVLICVLFILIYLELPFAIWQTYMLNEQIPVPFFTDDTLLLSISIMFWFAMNREPFMLLTAMPGPPGKSAFVWLHPDLVQPTL